MPLTLETRDLTIRFGGHVAVNKVSCTFRPGELTDAAKLVGECPGTRFILDHCGNAPIQDAKKMEQWKKDIAKVAEHKNVVGKVSGIAASAKKGTPLADQLAPAVLHTIEAFGWDRVMWASDWPHTDTGLNRVTTYPETLRWFEEWVPDKATRQTILVDTPARLYGF